MADKDHPPCPRCGCLHVKWIPRTTGVISGKTQNIDRTVKELVAQSGDKNYNSPRRGERAAPRLNPTVTPGRTMKFAPTDAPGAGWALDIPTANGVPLTYCGPTGVTAKVGNAMVGDGAARVKATRAGPTPRYEARHRP